MPAPDPRFRDDPALLLPRARVVPPRPGDRGPAGVRLDWVQYFRNFCAAHGEWPVLAGGRLLFPDGWRYSATDPRGPEWLPPEDPAGLRSLRRVYWTRRREIVRADAADLRHRLRRLEDLASVRSLPLVSVGYEADDEGRARRVSRELDVGALAARLAWLEADLEQCDRELNDHEL